MLWSGSGYVEADVVWPEAPAEAAEAGESASFADEAAAAAWVPHRRAWRAMIAAAATLLVAGAAAIAVATRGATPAVHDEAGGTRASAGTTMPAVAEEALLLEGYFPAQSVTQCTNGPRGSCTCNCKWATSEDSCKEDDGSCCHTCCCGEDGKGPEEGLLLEASSSNGGEFEELIKHEPGREKGCLCVFDVDRTLTGKPGERERCPGNLVVPGVRDLSFSEGNLTLSSLGQHIQDTFCNRCFLGIVTMGSVGNEGEKRELRARLKGAGGLPSLWCRADSIVSPLVSDCPDDQKAKCVKGVVDWYMRQGIDIPPSAVFFFDDMNGSMDTFIEYGYNARQVSCASRDIDFDESIGLCGATVDEIVRRAGIFSC
mmetsp:Transcript_105119/g.339021  ORF Transcript_105119/g.339021 Transcript_105119/m.339021 type:complete len:371 (-) Transcript_105119:87-1199(-)